MEKVEEIGKTGLVFFASSTSFFNLVYLTFLFFLEEVDSIYLPT